MTTSHRVAKFLRPTRRNDSAMIYVSHLTLHDKPQTTITDGDDDKLVGRNEITADSDH